MARPTKFTPPIQARILTALRAGATYKLAALTGGISYDLLNDWMNKGRRATRGAFFQFFQAMQKAEAERVDEWLKIIRHAAMTGTWTAAAWLLERLYPDEYGRTRKEAAPSLPKEPPDATSPPTEADVDRLYPAA